MLKIPLQNQYNQVYSSRRYKSIVGGCKNMKIF
jgi:hypothetical protein